MTKPRQSPFPAALVVCLPPLSTAQSSSLVSVPAGASGIAERLSRIRRHPELIKLAIAAGESAAVLQNNRSLSSYIPPSIKTNRWISGVFWKDCYSTARSG